MEVLYLHGRGEDPRDPPGDIVLSFPWKSGLSCPPLTAEWIAQPFPQQISCVDEWLEEAPAAIGYSWGAWLLLCAAHERLQRGLDPPPLLLVSCVLGEGNYTGSGLWKAPRCEEILSALGVGEKSCKTPFDPTDIRFVQGRQDQIVPGDGTQRLLKAGHCVVEVESGHLMRGPEARKIVSQECARIAHRLAKRPR